MELVRALSTTSSASRTEVQKQNRGVSKWSYHYVKELLLSAPRAPKTIFPPELDTTAPTEFTVTAGSRQGHLRSTIEPTSREGVATGTANAPTPDEPIQFTDGNKTDTPAALQENAVVPPHAHAAESANATDETIPSDTAVRRIGKPSPTLKLSKNFYISPNMRTDYRSQELWTEQIKDRLSAELWHALRKERCIQEFIMAGPRPNCLRASVVITCCGESAAKRVRKVVKRMKWLKDFDVPCAVVVDMVHLYSQEHQQTRDPTSTIEAQLPPNLTTLCGQRIRKCALQDNPGPFCTLGGLILVEGFPFGMTVEHPFEAGFEVSGLQGACEDQIGTNGDISSDDGESESPFISFDDENDGDTFENSFQPLHESTRLPNVMPLDSGCDDPAAHQHQEDLEGVIYCRIGKVLPSIRRDEVAVRHTNDWTLVEIDDPSCFLLNEIKLPTQNASIIIKDMVPEHFQDEGHVYVVLASGGVRAGWLMPSPVSFKVGNSVMDTRLIILDSKLGELSCFVPECHVCTNGMSFHSLW
jgi:hypothetical protein